MGVDDALGVATGVVVVDSFALSDETSSEEDEDEANDLIGLRWETASSVMSVRQEGQFP